MNLLIFDMDGVLLKPRGYHRALQETVRLAGVSAGLGDVLLTDDQIATFEALGISSEWHSSAICNAVIALQVHRGNPGESSHPQPIILDLENLFEAIAAQPMGVAPLKRGIAAIESLVENDGVPVDIVKKLLEESGSIQHSPTMNWFQELILGSDVFKLAYHKEPQFQLESYLKLYDQSLVSPPVAEKVVRWASEPGHGAAIMTNRPSRGPLGFVGAPDAELGAGLVGLELLPLIGFGEIEWLADKAGRYVGDLLKPGWAHALIAILAASGWPSEKSLNYVKQKLDDPRHDGLDHLQGSTITVFEDAPGGMVAVQEAGALLNGNGLGVEVRKIGIARESSKQSALTAQGAVVYSDINQALASLDDFGTFSSD